MSTAAALRQLAEKKAAELQRKIEDLQAMQRTLMLELERCGCGTGGACIFTTGAS